MKEIGETELLKLQCPVRSLRPLNSVSSLMTGASSCASFSSEEQGASSKRTMPSPIQNPGKKYLEFADEGHTRFYFPDRDPKTVKFSLGPENGKDHTEDYSPRTSQEADGTRTARYGLGNYLLASAKIDSAPSEIKTIEGLSRAGKRRWGSAARISSKRLESSGPAFLLSLRNHALRNFVYLHALESGEELPIGAQDPQLLDSRFEDSDAEIQGSRRG